MLMAVARSNGSVLIRSENGQWLSVAQYQAGQRQSAANAQGSAYLAGSSGQQLWAVGASIHNTTTLSNIR